MKKIILIFILLSCFFQTNAFDIATLWKIDSSVIDKVWVLKQEEKTSIESKIQALRDKYTTEILLIIIPSTNWEEISSVWVEIWQKIWVWKADKDNWVVILIAIDDRAWNISTWYGVEWVLPDLLANKIWEKNFVLFKESKYFDWIMWTLNDFWKAFEGDPSIISLQNDKNTETPVFWIFELIFVVIFSAIFLKPIYKKEKYQKFFIYLAIAYVITLPFTNIFVDDIFWSIIVNIVIWLIGAILWITWELSKWWNSKSSSWSGKSGWGWWFGWFWWGGFGWGGSSGKW